MNFCEVRRAQLDKSTLLTSKLVPLGSFHTFKVCSGAKERVGCGKQREATASIQSLVKLQLWFLRLRCKTCLRQNYSLAHSPTFPSLHLRHSSFSNPSVTSPTSQLILQPFRCFTYVTAHSSTLPLLHLRHSSFSNPSCASPTSQALLLQHLASRPWIEVMCCVVVCVYYLNKTFVIFCFITKNETELYSHPVQYSFNKYKAHITWIL